MKFIKLKINNQYLIVPKLFKDKRGIFNRSYCLETLKKKKLNFLAKQGNISENPYKGTLRGFHYQNNSKDSKIISCISGKMLNITIDIRKNSYSYLSITKNVLSRNNKKSIFVPGGCANLFLTLENNTIIHYYMNALYKSKGDRGIRYNDPSFKIKFPIKPKVISLKDKSFKDFNI